MLTKEAKSEIIKKYQSSESDTGSSEVQIALLSGRITYLTEHLKINKKDNHSRRGLIHMVNKRRKLLDYIKGDSIKRYKDVIESLGLRK